ncbi:Transmembrane BAX inhibitor motif-containing protein 4 [Ascosphaera aggregata]|nr:Transmembrane BAX inhibitor motif-containing protein 4 [Ascosphaera aggregata]
MVGNPGYTAVPSRDSFDHQEYQPPQGPPPQHHQQQYYPHYTQAPPSYQATDNIYGATPRSEDDNVPDDFKFGGSVAEATLPIRMQFIRKVYSILSVQLLLTTILSSISFFSHSYRHFIQQNAWLTLVSCIAAIVFMLLTFWKRKSYPANLLFLSGFTILEAHAVSTVTSFFEARIVIEALVLTLGLFAILTLFAFQTKYDFTSWQPYLLFALWFLILWGFMASFFPHTGTSEMVYGASYLVHSSID